MSIVLRGIPGAPGMCLGPIVHLKATQPTIHNFDESADASRTRFLEAQHQVAAQLEQMGAELRGEGKDAEAAIFDAQSLLARDPTLTAEVERLMADDLPVEAAVQQVTAELAAKLSALNDDYLKARADDVRAVGQHIIQQLRGESAAIDVPPDSIVIADDFTPMQIAALRKLGIAGIAAAGGGPTSHVAILARALGLPAVLGLGDDLLNTAPGAIAILDANNGMLRIAPSAAEREAFEQQRAAERAAHERRRALLTVPAQTKDHHRIQLWANIGQPDEAQIALAHGAEGIGLFRTEFLFLDRATPPSEAEQTVAYQEVLRVMAGRPVIARTLDVGGDKPIPYLAQLHESNPFLGTRGIRFAMRFPELFQTQLRALLRAAPAGDLRLMFPMVATPADVAWARKEIERAAESLRQEGIEHRADLPLGIMIETPAAAVGLDRLATGISFSSIGSNDLTQYTLAADRSDATLGSRYPADDPAVLRLIRTAVDNARLLGMEISLCGELAADPRISVALVGLGLQKLSMTPVAIPAVKEMLCSVTLDNTRLTAAEACGDPRKQPQSTATTTHPPQPRRRRSNK